MNYCALHLGYWSIHPGCLFIVQFGASWSTFSENILLRNIYNIDMGARIGGGGRVSFRPSTPPPWKKIIRYLVDLFCYRYLFSMLESFYNVLFPYGAAFMWIFLFLRGSFFGLPPPPPPPTNISAGAQF